MLRDWQIRSKLLGIFILPVIGLALLTSVRIAGNFHDGLQADREKKGVAVAAQAAALIHDLQWERDRSVAWVAAGRAGSSPVAGAQRAQVDREAGAYRAGVAALTLGRDDARLQAALRGADAGLGHVAQAWQLAARGPAAAGDVFGAYGEPIGALLGATAALSPDLAHPDLDQAMAAFEALTQAKEATSQERAIGAAVAASGRFAGEDYQRFAAAIGARQQELGRFQQVAGAPRRALLSSALNAPSVDRSSELERAVLAAERARQVGVEPGDWLDAMDQRIESLRLVERQLLSDLATANRADTVSAERQLLNNLLLLAIVLVLTVALAGFLARAMINPLVLLQRSAEQLAARQLPRIVERLQRGLPVDLAADLTPIAVGGRDEIGRLASSFDAAQRVAVRIAAEQAALRRSVSEMFVNLARRSQSLIDRQIQLIDRLEQQETDAAQLEEFFKIDHLATRMRRNAENLIVLSSSEPAHSWSEPVALVGLLRAAIAEVEDYQRVHVLPLDEVAVTGPAGIDMVHLLAELVENATMFSPADTKVVIAGETVSKGYLIEIEDRGVGMSDDELDAANERLADPPLLDFALARTLGFYVVGRLAQRYNIKAQLRHSQYGGITALVLLPSGVVLPLGEEGWRAGVGAWNQSWNQRDGIASLPAPGTAGPLPIFEAARSDWVGGGQPGSAYVPLRRHRAVPAGASAGDSPAPTAPAPAAESEEEVPEVILDLPPAPGQGATVVLTEAGLPRRQPMTNLRPDTQASGGPSGGAAPPPLPQQPAPTPAAVDTFQPTFQPEAMFDAEPDATLEADAAARSPEALRSLLTSYQAGLERGRRAAATTSTAVRNGAPARSDEQPGPHQP